MPTFRYQGKRPFVSWTDRSGKQVIKNLIKRDNQEVHPGDIVTTKISLPAPEYLQISAKIVSLKVANEALEKMGAEDVEDPGAPDLPQKDSERVA